MITEPQDLDDDDDDETDNDMEIQYPGYSQEAYNAARFIGIDFPYVAGDPGL